MENIKKALQAVCHELFNLSIEPELARAEEQFGDFATNVALQLASKLNKNPREIAEQITGKLKNSDIKKAEVAGPGFINIWLTDEALWRSLKQQPRATYKDQEVVIETNNPNPFKDIHIGHAFNSIVADTIANLLSAGGAKVHRVSYHGDIGLHVGRSLWGIFNELGDNPIPELKKINPADASGRMNKWYADGAKADEADPVAKAAIEKLTLQSFAPEGVVKEVYELCRQWSLEHIDKVIKQLGSSPVEKRYLESDAESAGRQIVESNKGQVFEESDGAVIFRGEKYGPSLHTVVFITGRGTTLYSTRDLGLILQKAEDFKPNASYIVTAEEQKSYFATVFKAAELAMPDFPVNTINISTGTVKLSTGKMKSRQGQVITIGWLFDQIEEATRKVAKDSKSVEASTLGALRYSMLKNRLDSDTIVDIEQSVSLEGNSGPYLQYSHARARSILAKAQVKKSEKSDLEAAERSLISKISEYPEVVNLAVQELLPSHITTYLYELAQVFNRFYEKNRVIDDPRQDIRLQLVESYADTLKNGLALLNIPAPESM